MVRLIEDVEMQRYNLRLKEKIVELSKPTSSAVVLKIPYADIDKEEYTSNKFIVYILVYGKRIHVGYSKNGLKGRDRTAEVNTKWGDCYILTQLKENSFFNSGIVQYIENKFIDMIKSVSGIKCNDKVESETEISISEYEIDDCESYIEEVYKMLYSIGLNFESIALTDTESDDKTVSKSTSSKEEVKDTKDESDGSEASSISTDELEVANANTEDSGKRVRHVQENDGLSKTVREASDNKVISSKEIEDNEAEELENCFYLKKKLPDSDVEVEAKMVIEDGKYKVLAGAKLSPVVTRALENTVGKSRKEVDIHDNILMRNYITDTPMAASNFVIGAFSNGLIEWKDKYGNPLRDTLRKASA